MHRRRRKYVRDDPLPNIQAHDSLASLHDFTSQVATKDGRIFRPKDVLVLHDPIDRIDSHALDSDRHMAGWRSTVWCRRDDKWSSFGLESPCCGVGRRGGRGHGFCRSTGDSVVVGLM